MGGVAELGGVLVEPGDHLSDVLAPRGEFCSVLDEAVVRDDGYEAVRSEEVSDIGVDEGAEVFGAADEAAAVDEDEGSWAPGSVCGVLGGIVDVEFLAGVFAVAEGFV